MSYILEALKKSQQERELGQVRTLQTSAFPAEEVGERLNLWILLAIILAILAVIIAAYAALRNPAPMPEPVTETVQIPGIREAGQPSQDPAMPAEPTASTTPVSVPPSLGRSATVPLAPARELPEAAAPAVVEEPAPVPEKTWPPVQETVPPAYRGYEATSKVPPDLIADIEAFKREVSEEQSEAIGAATAESEIAPQDLHLPEDVRKRLPEFVMSAHIYDRDSSKRFVLINGLKTREGEESPEEITVEQILPDGAVLRFDGHKFFQQRR